MIKFLNMQRKINEHKFFKDTVNPFYKSKYMTLDSILGAILPIINDEGLMLVQPTQMSADGKPYLRTKIFDTGKPDNFIECNYLLSPKKEDDPQALGSALTYARRYSLCSLLGIVADEDDDGNSTLASKPKKPTIQPSLKDDDFLDL